MNALQIEIAKTAIAKMFADGHFSICVIDNILKMSGGIPPKREYDMLHVLHCVKFMSMSPRLRLELPRLIQIVVESPPMMPLEVWQPKCIEA